MADMANLQVSGLAQMLLQCWSFRGAQPEELESCLSGSSDPVAVRFYPPRIEPIVRSGEILEALLFIQAGRAVPWQYPHSNLDAPYLLGEHEVILAPEQPRWVANYSVTVPTTIIEIPVSLMRDLLKIDPVRPNIERRVLLRMARYYWTSLSTNGSPVSRVAAALVSRLVLHGRDTGLNQRLQALPQKEVMRLTAMSRSSVAEGLKELLRADIVQKMDASHGKLGSGELLVPDVSRLKDVAFSAVEKNEIARLVEEQSGDP